MFTRFPFKNHLISYQKLGVLFSTTSKMCDDVLLEKVKSIGVITLNRPKQLNALNLPMARQIYSQLKSWENDSNISLILIQNSKDVNAFCAGGDIKAIRESAISGDIKNALEFFSQEYILNYAISTCKKPYVALINGITMGGGVGLSIHGKFRVATEKTLFAMPETAIGFFPDIGAAYPLSRLNGRLGVYLALTGIRLRGKEVYDSGIATHYINSARVEELQNGLQTIAKSEDVEAFLNTFTTEARLKYPIDKINSIFDADSVEKILENLANDKSEWSTKQLNILNKMSPTALKVTFEQFRLASDSSQSLKQVLELDYQLCQRFIKENDFSEGVRALLVDKDNKPNWIPKIVDKVSNEKVSWYFNSLDSDHKLNLESQSKL